MNLSDVYQDPIYQDLVKRLELAVRRLREDVTRLRYHHVHHDVSPGVESAADKWKAAHLQNQACNQLEQVRETAAELLRYGFELAPHSSDPEHLSVIAQARAAHLKRLHERNGWNSRPIHPKGPEEQIRIDDGPPLTIVLRRPDSQP